MHRSAKPRQACRAGTGESQAGGPHDDPVKVTPGPQLRRLKTALGTKDPGPPIIPVPPGPGSGEEEQLPPRSPTTGVPRGRKRPRGPPPPRPRARLRTRREKNSAGTRPGQGDGGGEPTAIFPGATNRQSAAPRPAPRRGQPALARPRRPLGRAGEGMGGEGTRDPGTGGGLRRREEPQEAGGAEKGAIDVARGPITSELGRASG